MIHVTGMPSWMALRSPKPEEKDNLGKIRFPALLVQKNFELECVNVVFLSFLAHFRLSQNLWPSSADSQLDIGDQRRGKS